MSGAPEVLVVGGGLAGCEAAFQLAERGHAVRLVEMKSKRRTPAQTSDHLAELVCSNSMRGAALANAVGLLKEELRRAGSLVLRIADLTRVPAGGALAVDRERFALEVTRAIAAHPRITVEAREVTKIPDERPVVIATGPLTGDALAADIAAAVGSDHLAYYDAIAPIVTAESIAWDRVFKQSRWGKSAESVDGECGDADDLGDEAYVNCPFDKDGYESFVRALCEADKVPARDFEEPKYFEGCLPCEVMAERGVETLRFGPMKPVGLTDPRTGRRPWAVIQLRAEDVGKTAYNLVGFQTRMKYGAQERVFRTIPGLEEAEFLRFGSVHRNTFVDAPRLLDGEMQLRARPGVYLAGQVSGVEGYVESAAGGFLCALMLASRLAGSEPVRPPPTTAFGGLLTHLSRGQGEGVRYQPSNITWAHFPPLEGQGKRLKKRERYEALAARAVADFTAWGPLAGLNLAAPTASPGREAHEGEKAGSGS